MVPTGSSRVAIAHVPETAVHVPRNVVEVLNVMVPVATDGVMEAVSVIKVPKIAGEPGFAARAIEVDTGPTDVDVKLVVQADQQYLCDRILGHADMNAFLRLVAVGASLIVEHPRFARVEWLRLPGVRHTGCSGRDG